MRKSPSIAADATTLTHGIQIQLSDATPSLELAETLPFATKPAGGWHITVLTDVHLQLSESRALEIVGDVCRLSEPFDLALDDVVRDRYLGVEDKQTVMLVASGEGAHRLQTLRLRLADALDAERRALWPEREGVPYWPHITLTSGLAAQDATELEAAVRESDLRVSHRVDQLWWVSENASGEWPGSPIRLGRFAGSAP